MSSFVWKTCVLSALLTFSLPFTSSSNDGNNNSEQCFPESDGMVRCIDDGAYKFYDREMDLKIELREFSYAGDFKDGVAIVRGSGWRSYGAIDRQGQMILDTIWSDIKPSVAGYMMAAKRTKEYITEDRGFGEQDYPKLNWFFIESETGNIIDEIPFKVIVNVHGFASAEDYEGNTYFIDVQRIHPGYYDPFMKAITHVNRQLVYAVLDAKSETITYRYVSNDLKALHHPFNPDPFSKYRFNWYDWSNEPVYSAMNSE